MAVLEGYFPHLSPRKPAASRAESTTPEKSPPGSPGSPGYMPRTLSTSRLEEPPWGKEEGIDNRNSSVIGSSYIIISAVISRT